MKKCPFCSEDIQDSAKKCKHCWEFLENSSVSKEYNSFNYSFTLENWRAQFVEFMEKEVWIHAVAYKTNTWTETFGWWSSIFDRHTVRPVESRTHTKYELSFNIEKSSPFASKEFVDLCYKYYNATYDTGFWGFWGFVVMFWICVAIASQVALIFGDLIPLSSSRKDDMTIILSPIFYYLLRKLILLSRKKTYNDSKSRYKKKIDTFLKR
jgi:hypothetical protein